ncbi:hypothetical protein IFR05_013081 [Cadophora sp. M221]|nr:hypothetical protein IFR05_013081 [Cadophora sp. M221]
MEAGWAQQVIDVYCNDVVSSTQISNPAEREKFHLQLHWNLRKRFHPSRKVNEYWTKKRAEQGGKMADIKRKKNGRDERPEHMQWPKAINQPEVELGVDFDGLGELMSNLQMNNVEREATDENAMVLAFKEMQIRPSEKVALDLTSQM